MIKYEEQVKECHQAMELAIDENYGIELLRLRKRLLNEEMQELNAEFDNLIEQLQQGETKLETRANFLKELADLQYVLSGTVVAFGLPFEEIFDRVHKSNMSKLVNGKVLKREDGKFLKGPNYKPPFLDDLAK